MIYIVPSNHSRLTSLDIFCLYFFVFFVCCDVNCAHASCLPLSQNLDVQGDIFQGVVVDKEFEFALSEIRE